MESKTLLYLDIAHKIDGRVILSARGRGPTFRGLTSRGLASKKYTSSSGYYIKITVFLALFAKCLQSCSFKRVAF